MITFDSLSEQKGFFMVTRQLVYDLETQSDEFTIRHFFISNGVEDLIKTIQYKEVGEYSGRTVFNLGFGNYDPETDSINDNDNSNNGDAYHIFNTVLSTIPSFFAARPNAFLLVMGSDSRPEFKTECVRSCKKKCNPENCKNFRRRINLYQAYVNKFWDVLNADYSFMGGTMDADGVVVAEDYNTGQSYDAVLVYRNNQ